MQNMSSWACYICIINIETNIDINSIDIHITDINNVIHNIDFSARRFMRDAHCYMCRHTPFFCLSLRGDLGCWSLLVVFKKMDIASVIWEVSNNDDDAHDDDGDDRDDAHDDDDDGDDADDHADDSHDDGDVNAPSNAPLLLS